jgi:hypothetical protein
MVNLFGYVHTYVSIVGDTSTSQESIIESFDDQSVDVLKKFRFFRFKK